MTYGYDNLYRLTSETIANAAMNGTVGYQYDAVGNRKQITSTLAAIPSAGLLNYDANDRTTTDQYDANGNTVSQGGIADTYDFENHLIQHGYITYVYDGDGNRVAKGFGGVTTNYLVDTLNPTGYAQVLDEVQNSSVVRSYTWGLQLVSESQLVAATPPASPWVTSWYGFDGHGSIRYLTNSTGVVTDTYDYDAFGNLINSTGRTANNYLFAGEQFDPDLGLYYNRARYLDVRAGRFWGMDSYEGDNTDPRSLHKYLYVYADPVDNVDQCGMCLPSTGPNGKLVERLIFEDFERQTGSSVGLKDSINTILGLALSGFKGGGVMPDLVDTVTFNTVGQVYEIKSVYSEKLGLAEVWMYAGILNRFDKQRTWIPGITYVPEPLIVVDSKTLAIVSRTDFGVITYCLINQAEMQGMAYAGAVAGLYVAVSAGLLEGSLVGG